MAIDTGEQISALMDEELEASGREMLIYRLSGNSALKDRWESYHLISEVLKNNLPESVDVGFASRISALIADEESPVVERRPRLPGWTGPAVGLGLAASVAAVAVLGLSTDLVPGGSVPGGNVRTEVAQASTDWETARPELRSRLGPYLLTHSEQASFAGVQGVLPYVRMVGYESPR